MIGRADGVSAPWAEGNGQAVSESSDEPTGAHDQAGADHQAVAAGPAGDLAAIPTRAGEAARRRGPFAKGDRVQLTDPKGRRHTVVLEPGRQFHTHRGALEHDTLIGAPEGSIVTSTGKTPYLALRPLLSDFVLAMP